MTKYICEYEQSVQSVPVPGLQRIRSVLLRTRIFLTGTSSTTLTLSNTSHTEQSIHLSLVDFLSLKKLSLFEGSNINTTKNIKLYSFNHSEITNQLVYGLLSLKENIAVVFINRKLHGNYISSPFIKEFASQKLSKSEADRWILDLSVGMILNIQKFTTTQYWNWKQCY